MVSRSPHGERGLKYYGLLTFSPKSASLSSRRAWIEIIFPLRFVITFKKSLSSRRAWIEIEGIFKVLYTLKCVALLTESVDWNCDIMHFSECRRVALLTESVDWNLYCIYIIHPLGVALLTESVDWNFLPCSRGQERKGRSPHGERGLKFALHHNCIIYFKSLSSRRAWIEIFTVSILYTHWVRRSPHGERGLKFNIISFIFRTSFIVALLTESVDWNLLIIDILIIILCRSPHGERGLKLHFPLLLLMVILVALLTESVDWNIPAENRLPNCIPSLSSRRAWIEIA